MSAQYHFNPDTYVQMIESEVPLYRELQRRVAEHTENLACEQVLELGTGTGVTSVEILRRHPAARLTGIDISRGMLERSGGRFVLGDLVIPQQPVPHPMPANPDYDKPSTSVDQVRWREQVGLSARVEWENGELAMIVGERRG